LQKLSHEFRTNVGLPSSGKIYLHKEIYHICSSWSCDEKGRFVLEKKTWQEFVRKTGLRTGMTVIFCITEFENGSHDMFFSEV
jgi:hypothetical protein